MSRAHIFMSPERMAIEEVLNLLKKGRIEIVNMPFFSRIESSPLMAIKNPQTRELNKDSNDPDTPYIQTTVRFYYAGICIAKVITQGFFSRGRGPNPRVTHFWRTAALTARPYFWRTSDKLRMWKHWKKFIPLNRSYGNVRGGSLAEEVAFEGMLARYFGWGRKRDGSEEHYPIKAE